MHTPTLALAVVLVSAILALVVGLVAERGQREGMSLWAAGLWAHTLAYGLFSLRGQVGEAGPVVLGHTLLASSLALVGESLGQFHHRRPHRLLLWAPVALAGLSQAILAHTLPARTLVMPAILGFQVLVLLQMQARARSKTVGRGQHLLAASFGALLPLLALRAWAAWEREDALADIAAPSLVQGLSFMLALSSALLSTLGFVLMSKERADQHIHQLALYDELTGLASRRHTLQALAQQVAQAQRSGQRLTVLMLDIDHFKRVNDEFGHLAGDAALRHVAQTMRARFRRQDLLGRFGGEEFLAILPATAAADGGMVLAEAVRQALATSPVDGLNGAGGARQTLTVSIGVAEVAPQAAACTETVIRAADLALYRAKQGGRNRVELARPPDYASAADQRMRMPGTAPGQGSST